MTSEALAVVRTFLDRDVGDIADLLDPDVVWFGTRGGLDQDQVLRGPDAVIRYMHEIREPWEHFDAEVERLIDTGDAVMVFLHERAQARGGGPEVHNETAMIIKVRDEKIAEMTGYLDREEALRAVKPG